MNYKETLNYIHSLGRFSLPPTLDRISNALNALGNPQNKFKSIHVAGTNGKGSVCAMLSSVFKEAGYKTGLFISPFIIDFRERIQINGEYISQSDLVSLSQKVIDTKVKLNEFEFITAIAFLYFFNQGCDIVVCETGLGGRLDATNTLGCKIASVITKIGLDHTAILGETIEEIAFEKCGIIKGRPTITSAYQNDNAFSVIKTNADVLIKPDLKKLKINNNALQNQFIYKGKEYILSLNGDYQIENALTVLETVENCGINIEYGTVCKALSNTYFPARMEVVSKKPLIIIDGAHNPDGASCLAAELKKHNGNAVAIIGVMQDKDYETVLETTLPHCCFAVAVAVEGLPRSLKADALCEVASRYCECVASDSYTKAIETAIGKAGEYPIFVFGSLYLAADLRKILLNK